MNRKGKCSANEEIKGKPTKRKDQLKCGMLLLPASGIGRREGGIGIGKEVGGGVSEHGGYAFDFAEGWPYRLAVCLRPHAKRNGSSRSRHEPPSYRRAAPKTKGAPAKPIYARDLQVSAKLPPFKIGIMLTVRLGYQACIDG